MEWADDDQVAEIAVRHGVPFLDGGLGPFTSRTLDDDGLEAGVAVTPTPPPGPDIEAALDLLDALESVSEIDVDETELREIGEQLEQYHERLAERLQAGPARMHSPATTTPRSGWTKSRPRVPKRCVTHPSRPRCVARVNAWR
jgi:predicted ATP-grasp superfamily ATP-dependent carboligase